MQINPQITRQKKKYPADDRMFGKSFGKSLRKFFVQKIKKAALCGPIFNHMTFKINS
jgi:hypothetical protein